VQVDKQNRVYAMGQTLGGSFPVTAGVYSNPGSSQFIIKLDSNLTSNIYSTVYGSGVSNVTNISPVAFRVDTCEQVYISGWGGPLAGNGGNTVGMPVTATTAVKPTTDGQDFYFMVLSKDANALLYGTFYGANTLGEHVDGGTSRFDRNGVVYQGICAGCGGSSAFPTTPGAWSNTNNSSVPTANCNYGAKDYRLCATPRKLHQQFGVRNFLSLGFWGWQPYRYKQSAFAYLYYTGHLHCKAYSL
jgi:hypothetical protein